MLAYIIENIEIILKLLFDIQPLVICKGSKKYAKRVVIGKLTMLPECKLTAQNVQIQFHQHQSSEYFPTLELFTHKRVIV